MYTVQKALYDESTVVTKNQILYTVVCSQLVASKNFVYSKRKGLDEYVTCINREEYLLDGYHLTNGFMLRRD